MKKAMLLVLSGALVFALLACGTGGGGGGAAADAGLGEGIPMTGEWFSYDDVSDNGGSSSITMEVIERDGASGVHVTGNVTTQYQYGFVGWGLEPDEESLELLKTARAISFKFVGDGKRQTVKYRISNVKDHAYHEYHFFGEPGEEAREEVIMRMFQQAGWGSPVRMNQANVIDVAWQTHESWRPGDFEITVWDVRIHP